MARINPAPITEYDLPLMTEGIVAADRALRVKRTAGDAFLAINGETLETPADVAILARMPERG